MLLAGLTQDVSQRIIFILQIYSAKGVQENMLKAWNFTKNKLRHRCFDNKLQKILQTNVLENVTGQILLIVNGRLMLRHLTELNFKWSELIKMIQFLLAARKIPFRA